MGVGFKTRALLSAGVLWALAGCQGNISGGLPTLDVNGVGGDERFDIVWSGAVPRRVSIAADQALRTNGQILGLETVRKTALDFITRNADFFRSEGISLAVD